MTIKEQKIHKIRQDWASNSRWAGIKRPYSAEEVLKLRGTMPIQYTLAERGAEKLWQKLNSQACVGALGAKSARDMRKMPWVALLLVLLRPRIVSRT